VTTPRLQRRVRRDFGEDAELVLERLREYTPAMGEKQDRERLEAGIVLLAKGDVSRLDELFARDWRDVLVWSGLGANWHPVLEQELGPT
jgi:hypothetical protein